MLGIITLFGLAGLHHDAQPRKSSCKRTAADLHLPSSPGPGDIGTMSALVDGTGYRSFEVRKCGYNVTLRDVYRVFAAHQVEWNQMGKTMAWWSVLTGFDKTADIPEKAKDKFYKSAWGHVKARTDHLSSLAGKSVLEFGCGLGRLAFSFANDLGADVTCVDQSIHHLDIAQSEWKRRRLRGNVSFVASTPDLIAAVGGQRFSFIHNVIVMQHMVPALQIVYIEQFCDLLEPGGHGWFQIPHEIDENIYTDGCDLDVSVKAGGMQMHSTPIHEISRALRARGCHTCAQDMDHAMIGGRAGRSAFVQFAKPASHQADLLRWE